MDSNINICLERADNELLLSKAIYLLSESGDLKKSKFNLPEDITFYSSVISHAYYGIFYSAKAYLISKNVPIPEQGQHNAVYYKFKQFVKKGDIDKELLNIYNDLRIKAKTLLEILDKEGENRTTYTYHTLPQANKEPSEKSIENAQNFVSNMNALIKNLSTKVDRKRTILNTGASEVYPMRIGSKNNNTIR